jgi:hypothetical protein
MSKELSIVMSNFYPRQFKQAKTTGYALLPDGNILGFNGKMFLLIKEN